MRHQQGPTNIPAMKNTTGSPSGFSKRTPDSNLNQQEGRNNLGKGNCASKYKRQNKCSFVILFTPSDLKDSCIKKLA